MKLGTFKQTINERKRYSVDYSSWLSTGESIASMVLTPDNAALILDNTGIVAAGTAIVFYAHGGVSGVEHHVDVQITTDQNQLKEDHFYVAVGAEE